MCAFIVTNLMLVPLHLDICKCHFVAKTFFTDEDIIVTTSTPTTIISEFGKVQEKCERLETIPASDSQEGNNAK